MTIRPLSKLTAITLLLGLCLGAVAAAPAATTTKPNILFILADDMGWSDLGCYGADLHETPNLDRFATGAVRFTNAYAMSVPAEPADAGDVDDGKARGTAALHDLGRRRAGRRTEGAAIA